MSLPAILATSAAACRARDEGAGFRTLTDDEAMDVEAVAARIIPSDDSPGSREAGVIHFIDAALTDLEADTLPFIREGLADLRRRVRDGHDVEAFSALDEAAQDDVLRDIEETEFFGTLRFLTLAGMFSDPSHGGNRDRIGWQLIGFDSQAVLPPPFGYYDADLAENGA